MVKKCVSKKTKKIKKEKKTQKAKENNREAPLASRRPQLYDYRAEKGPTENISLSLHACACWFDFSHKRGVREQGAKTRWKEAVRK